MSNSSGKGESCRQVEEHIVELCEGTAPEWVLEHVAECDRCRDLRYEAERLCGELADAGADFVVPADLEARLREAMGRLEISGEVAVAEPVAAGATEPGEPALSSEPKVEEPRAEEPKAETKTAEMPQAEMPKAEAPKAAGWEAVQELERERQRREAEGKAVEAVVGEGEKQGERGRGEEGERAAEGEAKGKGEGKAEAEGQAKGAVARKGAEGAKVVSLVDRLRRPRNAGLLALACAAAAAVIVAVAVRQPGSDPGAMASAQGWQGKVVRVTRAAGGSGGLEICDASGASCRPAEAQARIELGAVLQTDDRTRAYVELDDGSRLALDRSTKLGMLSGDERAARLETGGIVVDVAKIEGASAHIELPAGRLDVLGTKFALRALGQSVAVDVSRGLVRLSDREGRQVNVRAGEEGRMYPGMAPYASGAPALGEALSWSESDAERAGSDSAVRGLGELRAKKPGAADEQKGAVQLTSHQVKTRIVDGFARTEIEEVFTNTTSEVLEGIYRFPMPPDAQIERLALEVDGHYEEGAFVDRDRAAAIWRGAIVQAGAKKPIQEEIIWVPGPWKDPALLEWQRGGRFELRIYPIPRQGSRKVVLAYTQVVAPVGRVMRYVYPLGHDPSGALKVSDFGVDVQLRGHDRSFGVSTQGYALGAGEPAGSGGDAERLTMKARDFVPSGDLVVEYALPTSESELTAWAYQWTGSEPAAVASGAVSGSTGSSAAPAATATSGSGATSAPASVAGVELGGAPYVVMALRPRLPRATEQLERAFVLVVDASRSMVGERYRRASELAERLVRELDRLDRFTVLACDTSCRQLPGGLRFPGPEAAKEVASFLAGVTPEGGSDLGAQLREARAAASAAEGRAVRVVYLGDGTPTVGAIRPRYLERSVREALPGAQASLTAVAIGTDADLDALGAMARAGGGVVLPYVPGQRLGEAAYAILGASYGMGLREARLEMPTGLTEVAPQALDTIPAGGQALVVARMTQPTLEGTVVLRGKVGSESFEQRYPLRVTATTAAGNAFVPRLYAALRIADLERAGDAAARSSAIALSQRFNVASRYTSLLVLESAAMFKAFGLDNTRYAPSWTGEESTQSSEAEGELDVAGADDRDDALASGAGNGYGLGGGSAERKAKAAPPSDSLWGPETAAAPAAPAATSTAPWATPPAQQPPAGKRGMDVAEEPATERQSRPRRPPGRMVPMRKIWERMGSVNTAQLVPPKASAQLLGELEARVRSDENRREAVKQLYVLRLLAGQLDGARETAERWSSRDALDPDALVARADVAASSGQRELAIRILGSVVDVRPGDVPSQQRLARLHRWAGRGAVGCRHSLALAQLREKDGKLLADAVWCARQSGEGAWAEELLSAADSDTRAAADRELGKLASFKDELRGELRLEANWQGGADLDLALLHPDGHRVSWLGAPTKGLISAVDVASGSHEGLALLGSDAGDYVIEVTRASGEAPVTGTVSVTVPGAGRRDISFSMGAGEKRKALGLVNVRWQSRLVPL